MSHDKYLRGPASMVNKETEEPEDDLTISYLYGYNKGKDFSLAENKRLRDALQHISEGGDQYYLSEFAERALKGDD